MQLKKYIRRNMYRWHRVSGLLIAIPILLWTISGFLHPVMSSFKPSVQNQVLPPDSIDPAKIKKSLKEALDENKISRLHNFRIIYMKGNYFYQIHTEGSDSLTYLDCEKGNILPDGDRKYAAFLANRFLSEKIKNPVASKHNHQMSAASMLPDFTSPQSSKSEKLTISSIQLVKSFNEEYKSSQLLLPVYRVAFDRKDHIRLYIETSTSKLAAAIDDRKAWFTKFFAITHSWSFMDGMGIFKNLLIGSFSMLCFISSLAGFYIYTLSSGKQKSVSAARKRHRILGNVFVFTTMLFAISGAWHAFHKISEESKGIYSDKAEFLSSELDLQINSISEKLEKNFILNDVSVIRMKGTKYWQAMVTKGKENSRIYMDPKTGEILKDGDIKYGCYLACRFSGKSDHEISHSSCLTSFNDRYSMMNKRLPVIEVGYTNGENYYVETASGMLSAVKDEFDQAERFSFSNLHMQHFWESWLGRDSGKTVRNTVLISSTLGLLLLACTGLVLYFTKRRKKARVQQTKPMPVTYSS